EGLENVLGNILVERLPRGARDNIARQGSSVIRVGGNGPGREDAPGDVGAEVLPERLQMTGILLDQVLVAFLETRSVSHQIAQRDGLRVGGRDLEIEVAVHIAVEV